VPVIPIPTQGYPGLQVASSDLINSALRLINTLAIGEVPQGQEAIDGLWTLNQMVDSWQIERLMIYAIVRNLNDVFGNPLSLVSGQQIYPTGLSVNSSNQPIYIAGTFNIPRPIKIEAVGLIWLANPIQPLELQLTLYTPDQWAGIPVKAVTSTIPSVVWDDNQFPFRNLNFWPIPNMVSQIAIYTWQQLGQFPDLTTQFIFPPGYLKALRYNLAVDLAGEYGVPVPPNVAAIAIESKALVKTINTPLLDLRVDKDLIFPEGGMYDWRTDMPAGWGQR
jgi:hypothetical protein